MTRDGAVRQLVGLITQRSQVQILLPLLIDRRVDHWSSGAHPPKQVSPDDRLPVNTSKCPVSQLNACVSKLTLPFPCLPGRQPVLTSLFAQIAQLVEQWTENPRVAGSIPALGTKSGSHSCEILFSCPEQIYIMKNELRFSAARFSQTMFSFRQIRYDSPPRSCPRSRT